MLKMLTVLVVSFLGVNMAQAKGKVCTEEKDKQKWMTEEAFKAKVTAEGYSIEKFKNLDACYEIYGKNKDGKSVEIYFNPVDGSPMFPKKYRK